MSRIDDTLAALADPSRRAMVEMLREGPVRPSRLAEALELSRPAVSRHLKVLRQAELVREQIDEHDARVRLVQLQPAALGEVRGWIDDVQAMWEQQLDSFAAHVERKVARRRGGRR